MGRLSEYNQDEQDYFRGKSNHPSQPRFHSDTLPRVDHGMENWTTLIKLDKVVSTQPIFSSDMFPRRDHKKGGGRVLPHRNDE